MVYDIPRNSRAASDEGRPAIADVAPLAGTETLPARFLLALRGDAARGSGRAQHAAKVSQRVGQVLGNQFAHAGVATIDPGFEHFVVLRLRAQDAALGLEMFAHVSIGEHM